MDVDEFLEALYEDHYEVDMDFWGAYPEYDDPDYEDSEYEYLREI